MKRMAGDELDEEALLEVAVQSLASQVCARVDAMNVSRPTGAPPTAKTSTRSRILRAPRAALK